MQRFWFTPLLIFAAFLGWALATFAPPSEALTTVMAMARSLFLDGLKLIIAPLIFFSLISGILRLRGTAQMRSLGTTTLLYYLGTTGIAILIGLTVVTWLHPWTALPPLDLAQVSVDENVRLVSDADAGIGAVLLGLLQRMLVNPFAAMADLNILGIVTNAVLFGLAGLIALPQESRLPSLVHEITNIIYRVAGWIVLLAPVGILGIVYSLAQSLETAVITQLVTFGLVVIGATAVHSMVVLPLIAWWFGGLSPKALFSAAGRAMFVALTTSSSAATLPVSMQTAEERLGVRRSTASFVLPLGATINMDGTALFEGIAAVFLAYLFGVDLGTVGLFAVFFVAMIASVGAPGVPSGSMAGMQMVLLAAGIPLEGIGLLLLIERPLDTFRTAVNVQGDLVACVVAERTVFKDGNG